MKSTHWRLTPPKSKPKKTPMPAPMVKPIIRVRDLIYGARLRNNLLYLRTRDLVLRSDCSYCARRNLIIS